MNPCSISEVPTIVTKPIEPDSDSILSRPVRHQEHNHRFAYWYSPTTGALLLPSGERHTIPKPASIEPLLDFIVNHTIECYHGHEHAVNLYILAGRNNDKREKELWFAVTHDWHSNKDKYGWKNLTFKYWLGSDKYPAFTIYLCGTGSYFGDELKDITGIRSAWYALEDELDKRFGGTHLLADTPAGTGRELLLYSLPKDTEYPRIPEDLREFLYHNIPQGRVEVFPPQVDVVTGDVYVIDGKWFYASCLSHLPVGPAYHDDVNEFVGYYRKGDGKLSLDYVPGFYHVTVTVPHDWRHIGLIKEPEKGYPRTPGYTFTNWTTSAELALALDHGWRVHINERLFWPDTDKVTDPLAKWRKLLVDFRRDTSNPYHQATIRNIVLHMVGGFHAIGTFYMRFTSYDDPAIETIKPYRNQFDTLATGVRWDEFLPFRSGLRAQFVHPEWAATIWGRARARLAAFALQLPFEAIIALCNDAVYSTIPLETGNPTVPGSFRVKERIDGPFFWPTNYAFLYGFQKKHNLQLHEHQEKDTEL